MHSVSDKLLHVSLFCRCFQSFIIFVCVLRFILLHDTFSLGGSTKLGQCFNQLNELI